MNGCVDLWMQEKSSGEFTDYDALSSRDGGAACD